MPGRLTAGSGLHQGHAKEPFRMKRPSGGWSGVVRARGRRSRKLVKIEERATAPSRCPAETGPRRGTRDGAAGLLRWRTTRSAHSRGEPASRDSASPLGPSNHTKGMVKVIAVAFFDEQCRFNGSTMASGAVAPRDDIVSAQRLTRDPRPQRPLRPSRTVLPGFLAQRDMDALPGQVAGGGPIRHLRSHNILEFQTLITHHF